MLIIIPGFSGVTVGGRGGRVPPDTFHWEISADLPEKERQGNKGKRRREEKKENREKREVEKFKMEGEKLQNEERTFFFLFTFQNH